jgi:hypothetical protein
MRADTTVVSRPGPYFHAPVAAAITTGALEAVGLSAQPFADLTMDVLRTSAKGKWHVPGPDADCCPYIARAYGYHRTDLPTQPVPVLGEYDWCRHCIRRVGLPGPAGVFYTVAGLIVAAAGWVAAVEEQAPGMDWLDVARWTCRTPFGPPDPMPDLLAGLSGARGWARHRLTAQGLWQTLRRRTDAAMTLARQAAGPPGLRVVAARARDLVAGDPQTQAEAATLHAIAAGPFAIRDWSRPDAGGIALDVWLAAIAQDGDAEAAFAAMLTAVEERYQHAPVRDVSLLPQPALTPPDGHDSPAAWAAAEYAQLRRYTVAQWCVRLDDALARAQTSGTDTERLLLLSGWPITVSTEREIAYLTQYPVLERAVLADPGTSFPAIQEIPWVVVLRVPEFAADHATAHRSEHLRARAGTTILRPGQPADPREVRDLLRLAAGFLSSDADSDPVTGLPPVAAWRVELHHHTDLADWTRNGGHLWELPSRWQWIPDIPTAGDDPRSGEVLVQLAAALRCGGQPAHLRIAAGPPDALIPVDLIGYPQHADNDPRGTHLTYAPWDLPGCPTVRVPLHRIIAIADPR